MVDTNVLDAPLPVRRLSVAAEGFRESSSGRDDSLGPRSASHRVAFRLLGISRRASSIADDAAQQAAEGGDADLRSIVASVSAAVEAVLTLHPHVIAAESGPDPYAQHRARLRRDLLRRPATERTILALRHLVGLEPSAVAAITGRSEDDVRMITSSWTPADAGIDGNSMLQVIDTWTRVETDSDHGRAVRLLGHLDVPLE